jgi:mannose-6-phosphate isomerase-like protein (cupin superfamily)
MPVPQPAADGAVVVHGEDAETLGDAARAAVGLLADARDTGGAVSAVRVTLGDGADGAQPHRHGRSAELFFVLGGRAQMLAGDAVVLAGRGDLVVVPHGLSHAFGAVAGSGADLLVVLVPGIDRFDYFRLLERGALGEATSEQLTAAQERFDTWFLESTAWTRARARPGTEPPR